MYYAKAAMAFMKGQKDPYTQGLKFTISHFKHEFVQQYKMNTAFPAVFIKTDDTIKPFVTKEEIETCQSLQQLKDIILFKTSMHDQHNYSNI